MQIEVRNLRYAHKGFSLGPVSFSAGPGEILGIGGPNGSGKSTLMRLVLGLLQHDSGSILLDRMDMSEMKRSDIARRMAYLPQNLFSPLNLSVQDVLLSSEYSLSGKPSSLDSLISEFSLEEFRNRDFNTLSGGEKRIVMLAGAINQNADIILMDEPDTFLDVDKELFLYEKISDIAKSGKIVVIVFHDLNKLARLCGKVLLLKSGQQAAFGDADKVLVPNILERIYRAKFREQGSEDAKSLIAYS